MANYRKFVFHPAVLIPLLLLGFLGTALLAKVVIWPRIKLIQSEKLKTEAKQLAERENYSSAFIEIRKAILKNPTDPESYKVALEVVENSEAHYQYIPGFLQQLMKMEPDNPEHFNKFILLSLRTERVEEAQEAFKNYPTRSKDSEEYHQIGYSIGIGTENFQLADHHLEKLLELNPQDEELIYRLSTLRLQTASNEDQLFGAKVALTELAQTDNNRLPALRVLLAHSLFQTDISETQRLVQEMSQSSQLSVQDKLLLLQAKKTYNSEAFQQGLSQVTSLEPESPEEVALILDFMLKNDLQTRAEGWVEEIDPEMRETIAVKRKISQVYYKCENWAALKRSIIDEDWDDYEFGRYLLLARVSKAQSDPIAFRKYWQQCLIEVGSNRSFLQSLFQTTVEWGWQDESIEVLKHSFHEDPKDDEIFTVLVNHFMSIGDTALALEILERRVEYVPQDHGSKNNLALLSLLTGTNQSKAFTYAKENYELDPQNAFYLTTWAFTLQKQNRHREAVELIESLPNEEKMDPQRGLYLAKIYFESGKAGSARNYLNGIEEGNLFAEEKMLLTDLRKSLEVAAK